MGVVNVVKFRLCFLECGPSLKAAGGFSPGAVPVEPGLCRITLVPRLADLLRAVAHLAMGGIRWDAQRRIFTHGLVPFPSSHGGGRHAPVVVRSKVVEPGLCHHRLGFGFEQALGA